MAPLKIPKPSNKKLAIAANLSNLLPTGTVLAFQALMPSFTNNGSCMPSHKVLTSSAIISLSLVCFFSSLTDSFIANGKLYYGIATLNGLYIFNKNKNDDADDDVKDNNKVPNERDGDNRVQRIEEGAINLTDDEEILANNKVPSDKEEGNRAQHIEEGVVINRVYDKKKILADQKKILADQKKILAKYKIQPIDYVHAFCSLLVFMVYAMCSSDVMRCFHPHPSANVNVLMMNLPLAVGSAVSFLFMLFPTKRRGIGLPPKRLNQDGYVNNAFLDWEQQDQILLCWILSSISQDLLPQLVGAAASCEAWNVIDRLFSLQLKANMMQLKLQLQTLKKGTSSISEYLMKKKSLIDALMYSGIVMSEDDKIKYVMGGLRPEYDPFMAAMIASLEIESDPLWYPNSGATDHCTLEPNNLASRAKYQ
ncbi:hypothetical protein EZV62_006924 [Acer yangbiense]|uniref:Retrotransposon Copia-like N-terminal domain-containing protein n=1 Tax=Acer yangbiense TaxID=1000413 RepID=A0A5C7IA75_9ROSI|nr:hypothetical protein EZV62_006924 [Acer yangbiense]